VGRPGEGSPQSRRCVAAGGFELSLSEEDGAGEVRAGQLSASQVSTGEVSKREVRAGKISPEQARTPQVCASQIGSGQGRAREVGTAPVEPAADVGSSELAGPLQKQVHRVSVRTDVQFHEDVGGQSREPASFLQHSSEFVV
jgi:hypothetical protein